jgi:hypothetical protein
MFLKRYWFKTLQSKTRLHWSFWEIIFLPLIFVFKWFSLHSFQVYCLWRLLFCCNSNQLTIIAQIQNTWDYFADITIVLHIYNKRRNNECELIVWRLSFIVNLYLQETFKPGVNRGLVDTCLNIQETERQKDGTCWLTDDMIRALILDTIGGGTNYISYLTGVWLPRAWISRCIVF